MPKPPRTAEIARLDAEIARLGIARTAKAAEADEYAARHVGNWSAAHQDVVTRLDAEAQRLTTEIGKLRERRFQAELGTAPVATAKKASGWKIRKTAAPTFPAEAYRAGDEAAMRKDREARFAHALTLVQSGFRAAGVGPTQMTRAADVAEFVAALFAHVTELDLRLDDAAARLAELESGPIRYRGAWQRAESYRRGSVVTDAGSAWHAIRTTSPGERPGASDAFQLMVKSGRDAR